MTAVICVLAHALWELSWWWGDFWHQWQLMPLRMCVRTYTYLVSEFPAVRTMIQVWMYGSPCYCSSSLKRVASPYTGIRTYYLQLYARAPSWWPTLIQRPLIYGMIPNDAATRTSWAYRLVLHHCHDKPNIAVHFRGIDSHLGHVPNSHMHTYVCSHCICVRMYVRTYVHTYVHVSYVRMYIRTYT